MRVKSYFKRRKNKNIAIAIKGNANINAKNPMIPAINKIIFNNAFITF